MVPAYMAIQFRGLPDEGWLHSSQDVRTAHLPTSADDPLVGPPTVQSYFEVRAYSHTIKREFEGTGTSGGPNTVFRSDHTDLSVEKVTDRISPYLLEYCLSGKQLGNVHLVNVSPVGKVLHVRLQDVHVSGFEFAASRFFGEEQSALANAADPTVRWSAYVRGTSRIDKFTLYYTGISTQVRTLDATGRAIVERSKGWSTGTEATWPPPPPPPSN